jgi:photosystem II stability/assembly factor-like uncharacterized protein
MHLRVFEQVVRLGVAGILFGAVAATAGRTAAESGDRVRDNLYGVRFVTAKEGWAAGAFGTVARTVDGGASWHLQPSRTTEQLFDVDFVDSRRGWIVGRSGLILHTEDGGDTWAPQTSGTDKHLFAVDFVDAEVGVAVGDWGTVVVTRDGGETWEGRSLPNDVILYDVQMLDRSAGWIVGELGTVLRTEDGGSSWVERPSGINKTLFGLYFADPQRGWLVGLDGLIVHTDDGGATWQIQRGSNEVGTLEQVQFSQSVEDPSLYAVAVTGERGFAVGEAGAIFTSGDGGRSWRRKRTPRDWGMSWLRSLSIVPGTHGAIVGAGGLRVMVADGRIELPEEESNAAKASD